MLQTDEAKLDELHALLAHCSSSSEEAEEQARLADEHIQTAHAYLLGAMNVEYAMNLELARQALAGVSDRDTRTKAEEILDALSKTAVSGNS
jgi:hypothetical protein